MPIPVLRGAYRLSSRSLAPLVTGLMIGLTPTPVDADQFSWIVDGDGDYGVEKNWDPIGVPGSTDAIIFDIASNYTVVFDMSPTVVATTVAEGEVEFDLDVVEILTTDSLIVGDANGDIALLVLTDGLIDVPTAVGQAIRIGKDVGAEGTLQITSGSSLVSAISTIIGDAGTGALHVDAGAALATDRSFIGDDAGSSGTIAITGPGATWNESNGPTIGNEGDGAVTITGGAIVQWDGLTRLADDPGSTGDLQMNDAGSSLTVGGELFVGNVGLGTIAVQGGAALTTNRTKLGDETDSAGIVQIDGVLSSWLDTNEIFVGNFGTGELTVSDGATVTSPRGTLGDDPGSEGTVEITGIGSTWTTTVALLVGDLGTGSLTVRNGGRVESPALDVGASGTAGGNGTLTGAVTVTGILAPGDPHGTLTIDGSWTQSAGAHLEVDLGASVLDAIEVTGAVQLGGTLDVTLIDGDLPINGSTFTIINGATITGTFDDIIAPGTVTAAYDATSVTLTVVDGGTDLTPGDIDGSGTVDFGDVLAVLSGWGVCPPGPCAADLDDSGDVGFSDLLFVLSNWGAGG